jgi:hypothetical protein
VVRIQHAPVQRQVAYSTNAYHNNILRSQYCRTLESRLEQLSLLLSPATMLGTNVEFLQIMHACVKSLKTLEEIDMAILDRVIAVSTVYPVPPLSCMERCV